MQFNDDVRVYKGTVTKVKQLRHKTVYVCEYDDADNVQHTEEELCIALHFAVSDYRQTLKTAPKCAARRAYSLSLLHACIYHKPRRSGTAATRRRGGEAARRGRKVRSEEVTRR
jgi:hypothetical protein